MVQAVTGELEGVGDAPFDVPLSPTKDPRSRPVAALLWTARLAAEIAAYSVVYLLVTVICIGAIHLVGLL
jgi:hypothetical protein